MSPSPAPNEPARVFIVDDDPVNRRLLTHVLGQEAYAVTAFEDGPSALEAIASEPPDIVLLDIRMTGMDGFEVCRRIRADPNTVDLAVVMITAEGPAVKLAAIEVGADDFILKPFDRSELSARVRSLVRIRRYHDTTRAQATELEIQAAELAEWNRALERRVTDQVHELESLGRLRRFLSPQVADLVIGAGHESLLEAHRRYVSVFFCDLRGFTAFSEGAEPEELMGVLADYHRAVGEVLTRFGATVGDLAGDSVMAYFNDPLECAEPEVSAVQTALAVRAAMADPITRWRKRGHDLRLGLGVASGYATLGMVGFEGRHEYKAVGSVVNLAARLCSQATSGQILVDQRVHAATEDLFDVENAGEVTLKGVARSVPVLNVVGLRDSSLEKSR